MTSPPVRRAYFTDRAEREYTEARRFIAEHESVERSGAFRLAISRAVGEIERFPEAAPVVFGSTRRKLLLKPPGGKRFRYAIFYAVEPDRIRLLSIPHLSRDPKSYGL